MASYDYSNFIMPYQQPAATQPQAAAAPAAAAPTQQSSPTMRMRFSNTSAPQSGGFSSPFDANLRSAALSGNSAALSRIQNFVSTTGNGIYPTRTNMPTFTVPQRGALPTFKAPEYNEKEVNALTQKKASPTIRRLRQAYQQAAGRNYENPNVKSMTLRSALQGYGIGSAQALESAGAAATNEYNQKYSRSYNEAMTNFNAKLAREAQDFQAALGASQLNFQTSVGSIQDDYNKAFQAYMGDKPFNGGTTTTWQRTALGGLTRC
jgi:hypothetical protein